MSLAQCIGQAAQYYNIGLAIIALALFIKLLTAPVRDRRVYILPWKLLFIALMVFVVEEIMTILRVLNIVNIPIHINGFFELVMICTFIYMLLLQKEHMKQK